MPQVRKERAGDRTVQRALAARCGTARRRRPCARGRCTRARRAKRGCGRSLRAQAQRGRAEEGRRAFRGDARRGPWPTRRRKNGCWPRRMRLRGACRRARTIRPCRFPCPIWPSRRRRRASRARWWWARGRRGCSARCTWPKRGCGRSWWSGARAWRSAPAAVAAFDAGGPLDPQANVQFGEGGAGTFSDGKLTTGIEEPAACADVLEHVRAARARPRTVLWQAKPHIGTDLLAGRGAAPCASASWRPAARCASTRSSTGLRFEDGRARRGGACRTCASGATSGLPRSALVLACGHSRRATRSRCCVRRGVADGARSRSRWACASSTGSAHGGPERSTARRAAPRAWRGRLQAGRPSAGRDAASTRSACARAGTVVAAASEEGGVVHERHEPTSRATARTRTAPLLVDVRPEDLAGDDVLGGRRAAAAFGARGVPGGARSGRRGVCGARPRRSGDFLAGRPGAPEPGTVASDVPARACVWCDLRDVLAAVRVPTPWSPALPLLGSRSCTASPTPDAVHDRAWRRAAPAPCASCATGNSRPAWKLRARRVRIRAGKPPLAACLTWQVRLPRQAPRRGSGLYPCGEGAGYAGGIMSAAVDGLRVAEALARAVAEADPYPSNQA